MIQCISVSAAMSMFLLGMLCIIWIIIFIEVVIQW